MNVKDKEGWKHCVEINSHDGYSKACVDYAVSWAELMEIEMEKGIPVDEAAEDTQFKADNDGITGFMYGCAVSMLSQFWEHGEELKKWHNKEWGAPEDAKGVVNPAILTIGGTDDN